MKKTITSVFLASAALILSACGGNAPTSSPTPSTTSETPIESSSVPVPSTEEKPTTSETPSTTSEEKPVPSESSSSEEEQVAAYAKITLADGATTIEGENHGVTLAGNVVTITKKGTYDIFGTFTNGSIVVASSVKGDVELDLNGCSITRTGGAGTSAPIVNLSSYRMKVKKIKKTTSAIIDNRTGDNGDPAAIYSKGEVGLVGKGTIEITSTYTSGTDVLGFGMASETYAYAKNGVQTITSPGDCINARRSIIVGSPEDGGTFTFTSTSDHGLNVEEETATAAAEGEFIGVKIQQGDYTVVTSNKAIDSQYGLVIEEPATYIDDAG
ncbi:MAG: carbohydrate-binding domain-containing protein, partial [Bacilli bacterium]|nr:carbohydrate-binding domain-containing protein [Bacilli bacterium]